MGGRHGPGDRRRHVPCHGRHLRTEAPHRQRRPLGPHRRPRQLFTSHGTRRLGRHVQDRPGAVGEQFFILADPDDPLICPVDATCAWLNCLWRVGVCEGPAYSDSPSPEPGTGPPPRPAANTSPVMPSMTWSRGRASPLAFRTGRTSPPTGCTAASPWPSRMPARPDQAGPVATRCPTSAARTASGAPCSPDQ